MKILIVTPHVFPGGAEKVVLHSAWQLKQLGCEVGIATLSLDLKYLPSKFKDLHYFLPEKQSEIIEFTGVRSIFKTYISESYALTRLLRRVTEHFDVINPFNFPSYWTTAFDLVNRPIVWTCSEILEPYRQTKNLFKESSVFRWSLKLVQLVDRHIVRHSVAEIVTCSELNRALIEKRYNRDTKVMPTCVDYDFFSRHCNDTKKRFGFGDGVLLLHVGALVPSKNHILSIRALKILKQQLPNAKLVIVGSGPYEPVLKEEVTRLGLQGDVFFRGVVSEEDLLLLYQACDLNLYPVQDQTYGLVPFEALAAGKLSVVSEECGAAEVIRREKIGVLIKPRAEDLAIAMVHILSHPDELKVMVDQGRRYVENYLSWKKYAEEMLSVYRDAINSKY